MVIRRAFIAIITKHIDGQIHATQSRIATIVRARIAVIAIDHRACRADAVFTSVADGAHAGILAGFRIVDIDAAVLCRVATVISTGIPVVAVCLYARFADAIQTVITQGAGRSIVTGESIIVRNHAARAVQGIAGCLEAGSVKTLGLGTLDHRVGLNLTLVRQFVIVTDEVTVAQVVVFQRLAVIIHSTVTGNWEARAGSL